MYEGKKLRDWKALWSRYKCDWRWETPASGSEGDFHPHASGALIHAILNKLNNLYVLLFPSWEIRSIKSDYIPDKDIALFYK